MKIDNQYNINQIVFLICDLDQQPRMVTAICVRNKGFIEYELSCGTVASWHGENEINEEKTVW